MRPEPARKGHPRGRRLAKRFPDVQQAEGLFPGHRRGARKPKSRRNPAAFPQISIGGIPQHLEPIGTPAAVIPARSAIAIVAMIPITAMIPVAAVAIAIFMVPPAAMAEMRVAGKEDRHPVPRGRDFV